MIARALAGSPSALLLDEPSAGLGAGEVPRLAALLSALKERGLAVLLVEHNLALVRSVADTVTVLDAGRVVAAGAASQVWDNPAVRAAFLGRRES
jgi:ABC-type branched-subunit amino acid transport system ATPase component